MSLWPRSYYWRLGLALICMQVVVGVALAAFGLYLVRSFHFDAVESTLRRLTPVYAELYRPLLADAAHQQIAQRSRPDARQANIRLTVILPDGSVVGDSNAEPRSMDNHRYRPEIDAAIAAGEGQSMRFGASVGHEMFYYARRVDDPDGRPLGVVRTSIAMTEVSAAFLPVAEALLVATTVSMLITIGMVFVISRHFGGLVSRLAAGARRVAEGDFGHRLIPPTERELHELAASINAMAENVGGRIQEIERQRQEEEAILQAMTNGVIAIDHNHRVINLNHAAERILGVSVEQSRGRLLEEISRASELHQFVDRAMNHPAGHDHTEEFTLTGPNPMMVRAVAEPMPRDSDEASGLLVLLEDITRIRRLETLRSDFASNVSHELRTPITNLKGYVETLLEVGVDDADQVRRFLNVIKHNSERLSAIVDDVMMLTELERPRAEPGLEQETILLQTIVSEVVNQFSPAASEKAIVIETDVAPGISARVHARLIGQAIGNLVSNAINYSSRDTTVTIRVQPGSDDTVVISVADQGPGIQPVHRTRLFERFYRADSARSRALGGTGLGLAIVKHITLAHGGTIGLLSEVGRGSTFSMTLPVAGA